MNQFSLINAISAEQQAVAIYEAQVFWRPGLSGQIFREILSEERLHLGSICRYFSAKSILLLLIWVNKPAGWLLGTFLSVLPRLLCYRIHVWAEVQAAKTYEQTLKALGSNSPNDLLQSLSEAAKHEHQHAERFKLLLQSLSK